MVFYQQVIATRLQIRLTGNANPWGEVIMGEACKVESVTSPDELEALRPEWCALYAGAPGKMAAQHPAYFDAAREVASPGRLLAAVTVRRAGALTGLWPLSFYTMRGCRVACHPGAGGHEEYAGMLVAPDADAAEVVGSAIGEIRRHADFVTVYNLPSHAPMIAALRRNALASSISSIASFVVDLSGVGGWDRWLQTKSKNFRQNLGGQRRNLAKRGVLESVQDEAAVIPWFFREKRKWLEKTGGRAAWVSNPALGERFFGALARQPDSPLKTFALKIDGAYIAAGLCVVSENRLEYIATVYADGSEWERYSPGMLVSEDCGRWAVENGLDLDFRFMDVPYKHRWVSRTDRFVTVRAAFSPRGMIEVYAGTAVRQSHRVKVQAANTVRDCAALLKSRLTVH